MAVPTSSVFSFDLALPQMPQYNDYPGPVTTYVELNDTKTTTDGSTITSPAAFYEFSSVRIVVVPAVTDQSGEVVCITTSTYTPPCTVVVYNGVTQISGIGDTPFSGINAYAESYFGGSLKSDQFSDSRFEAGANLSNSKPRNVTEIHFTTPFVYLPLEGANESLSPMPVIEAKTDEGVYFLTDSDEESTTTTTTPMSTDSSGQDYGYVPQALIDWMARDPNYVSQYPYLASCYPGGPTIKPDDLADEVDGVCSIEAAAAQAASAVPDLTTSTQVTVSSAGCFHPGACPTPAPAATPNAAVPADTALNFKPEEASVLPSIVEQSQTRKAIIPNSPTTVPSLGDMIVGALGGLPFAPLPDAPSPAAPAPKAPTPNVPTQNAPTLDTEGGQNPLPSVPATPAAGGPIVIVGSQSIILDSASHFVVAGQTLTPGAPEISIQGTPVSLAPSAIAIVVAGSTIALPVPVSAPVVTIGDRPVTANSALKYVVDSKTLIPGGTAIMVSGTLVSLAPSGTQIVIGSSTIPLLTGQSLVLDGFLTAGPGSSPPPITVGGQVFTPNTAAFAIAGTTLSAGGPGVTISGTLVSLGPSGNLVIGTSTSMLSSEASPSVFTVGGQTFTASPTAFFVAGTKISAGGPGVTISGTPVSLEKSGSLVIGTSITKLSPTAFTVGNQVFTPNPTAFSIAGTTISAGGPGVTIAGTPVNLGPSGSLVIGNSTIQLSPTSTGALGFTGRATRKSTGLRYEILGLILTCAIIPTSH